MGDGGFLTINLRSRLDELLRLLSHPCVQRLVFGHAEFCGVVADILRDLHRAEMWAAHRAEVGDFRAVLWQRFIMEFACRFRIEREVELVLPAELEAGLRDS